MPHSEPPLIVRYDGSSRIVVERSDSWGLPSVTLVGPPRRFYTDDAPSPPLWEQSVDERRVVALPSPARALAADPPAGWLAESATALRRLQSFFLVAEDPQGRLLARGAATLAHQVSLVQHILDSPDLDRVLIADEVGLGKTIEAGLLIDALLRQDSRLRILYLAPARLVSNVRREMAEKLSLEFRMWAANELATADMERDPLIVASIHRAVVPLRRDDFAKSGPWDVLLVDECHHLTAHGAGGGGANEHYKLVRELVSRMAAEGRVILLSGTPHQGNTARFENLLDLISRPGESRKARAQRVIFRTKEDVRDWNGNPLFPVREVRQPRIVSLGPTYRVWYEGIAELYDLETGSVARRRASAWAKGQALQWAASSVEAGLGFLARMSIRRLGWPATHSALAEALAALRPYKGGAANEPVGGVHARMVKEIVRQQSEADIADLEGFEEETWVPDAAHLAGLLTQGVSLMRSPTGSAKWDVLLEVLQESPNEKFVLFAQPVETVMALVRLLESATGETPALIVGGQSEQERQGAIRSFWKRGGPRILVSSSAGGEGINLQIARRLVHLDVPWNPMDMEQRVGRVHRFGSRQTILVDTIVVDGTREVDAYRYAREKLRIVAKDLAGDQARFESLYARVMSLVPPEEFEGLLAESGDAEEELEDRLGPLIEAGFKRWKDFHDRFAEQATQIRMADGGAVQWKDLEDFVTSHIGATRLTGFAMQGFRSEGGKVVGIETPVPALELDGHPYVALDAGGVPVVDASGRTAKSLGVNVPRIAKSLRDAALGPESGAAWLRAPEADAASFDATLPKDMHRPCGVLAFARQRLRIGHGNVFEQSTTLHVVVRETNGSSALMEGDDAARLVRALQQCVRQRVPRVDASWCDAMRQLEADHLVRLKAPASEEAFGKGIRHAVWAVFAAVVE